MAIREREETVVVDRGGGAADDTGNSLAGIVIAILVLLALALLFFWWNPFSASDNDETSTPDNTTINVENPTDNSQQTAPAEGTGDQPQDDTATDDTQSDPAQ